MTSHWRRRAREVIDDVLASVDASDVAAATKAIDDAYPFGPREHWPYRMWLLERRRALALLGSPGQRPIDRWCPACGRGAGRPCRDIETGRAREMFHEARMSPEWQPSRAVNTCLWCGAVDGESCRGAGSSLCCPEVRGD